MTSATRTPERPRSATATPSVVGLKRIRLLRRPAGRRSRRHRGTLPLETLRLRPAHHLARGARQRRLLRGFGPGAGHRFFRVGQTGHLRRYAGGRLFRRFRRHRRPVALGGRGGDRRDSGRVDGAGILPGGPVRAPGTCASACCCGSSSACGSSPTGSSNSARSVCRTAFTPSCCVCAREAGVTGNAARIDPAPRHTDIASQISTYREQVTRELSAMVKQGLVQRSGRALVIPDVARLERLVSEVRRSA